MQVIHACCPQKVPLGRVRLACCLRRAGIGRVALCSHQAPQSSASSLNSKLKSPSFYSRSTSQSIGDCDTSLLCPVAHCPAAAQEQVHLSTTSL